MAFDKDFAWGVACSAYQTEGAENEDGRGESIWDSKFTKGKTLGDMNGKIACDHYHRYKEDVASFHFRGRHRSHHDSNHQSNGAPDQCQDQIGQNLLVKLRHIRMDHHSRYYQI